jgi:hypothetical protein
MIFTAKLRSTGAFPRLDLTEVERLLPALRAEWADLDFGRHGAVRNPVTGATEERLALVAGDHRRPGATYRLLIPTDDGPADDDRTGLAARLRDKVAPRPRHRPVLVDLRRDDDDRLECTVRDPDDAWRVNVDVTWADLPQIDGYAAFSPKAMFRGDEAMIGRLLGRRGVAEGRVVTARLGAKTSGKGPSLLAGEASLGAGSVTGAIDVDARRDTWNVVALATVRARGVARVAMPFLRRRLVRSFDAAQRAWWADAVTTAGKARTELDDLAADIARAGSPEAFVRAELWDPATRARRAARRPVPGASETG